MTTAAYTQTDLLLEMHDLYGAYAGASAWREAADGFVKRREVKACYVKTESALRYACRYLQPEQADALRAVFATGEAIVFTECLRIKRQRSAFGSLQVGLAREVVAHSRLYPIGQFKALKPLHA